MALRRPLTTLALASLVATGSVAVAAPSVAAPAALPGASVAQDAPDDSMLEFHITDANVPAVVQYSHKKPLVIEFSNKMCSGCQDEKKVYQELAKSYGGSFLFVYADNEVCPNLQKQLNVEVLPTSFILWQGKEHARKEDFTNKEHTAQWVADTFAKLPPPAAR